MKASEASVDQLDPGSDRYLSHMKENSVHRFVYNLPKQTARCNKIQGMANFCSL